MISAKRDIATLQHYLRRLLQNRSLPSETIIKVVVIVIGTHWHARQSSSIGMNGSDDDATDRRESEDLALELLLETYGTILDTSSEEVEEGLRSRSSGTAIADDDEELHQYISAVLRRCLPALRVLSKWLKLHTTYLSRLPDEVTQSIWSRYDRFTGLLQNLFSMSSLPGCNEVLEEDVDMRGFVPLMRGLSGVGTNSEKALDGEDDRGEVHPNEQQLMRISDLQVDAKLLSQAVSVLLSFTLCLAD
jgi:hypothetical protein